LLNNEVSTLAKDQLSAIYPSTRAISM